MSITEIYADGSLGRRDTAGLGWVLITGGGPLPGFNAIKVAPAFATIQWVELNAIKAAIKAALATGRIMHGATIYTDSLDAITMVDTERLGRKRGRPSPMTVQYRDLIRWIALELRLNGLTLKHIRGHSNSPGNEAADRLAVMARRNREYGLDRNHGHAMAVQITADYTSALTARTGNHWASPAAISLHRASGEPLCAACAHELDTLEREAS